MRIATGQYSRASDEELAFAAQLGVEEVVLNTPGLPGHEQWEVRDLVALRLRCESFGLRLAAIENTPVSFYLDAILNGPWRDDQIERYAQTVRNLGAAEIPILGFHWIANGVWRTSWDDKTRGGARTNSFDTSLVASTLTREREYSADEIWENFSYFVRAIAPVAEEAGVTLALHPDDPPVESLGGIARIFTSFEALDRGMSLVEGSSLGLDLCIGTCSEMGPDVVGAVRRCARAGNIVYVHFGDVWGHVPVFTECFLADGNLDPAEVMSVLLEEGFDGFAIYDHAPFMAGDTTWPWRGEAFQTEYLMGLLDGLGAGQPRKDDA